MVKVKLEKLEGSKVSLVVEVPADAVDASLDRAYKTVVKRINVPGFRRGKAPRSLVERYYGKEALNEEALKNLLPEQYSLAVDETKIEPVDDPDFEEVVINRGEPMTFTATVAVRPDVVFGDYSDISVPFESAPVTDEDVASHVRYMKERMTQLRPIEDDQPLEEGDVVSCHLTALDGGDEEGREFPYIEIGREYPFAPGLSLALKGMIKGEEKEFSSAVAEADVADADTAPTDAAPTDAAPTDSAPADSAPADAASEAASEGSESEGEEAAGSEVGSAADASERKELRFRVRVNLAYKKLEPSDEELLKNYGETVMEELESEIRKGLERTYLDQARRQHEEKVADAVLERTEVDIPEVMIQQRQSVLVGEFADRLQSMGSSIEKYLEEAERGYQDLFDANRDKAEKEIKTELVFEALGVRDGVQVSPEAVDAMIESIARRAGRDVETVRTTMEMRGQLKDLERPLLRMETLKKMAAKAAERAGTPLPPEEEPKATTEESAEPVSVESESAAVESGSSPAAEGELVEEEPKAATEDLAEPASAETEPAAVESESAAIDSGLASTEPGPSSTETESASSPASEDESQASDPK